MNDEIREILEHLKEYLQSKIDNNEHKIFYNDLMWDEKTIDCINAIDDVLNHITNLQHQISLMEEDIRESKEINGELQQDNEKIGKLWREEEAHCILLQQENERLKELCDKYEEEHSTEFKIWKDERHKLLDYKSRCEKAKDKLRRDYYTNYTQHNDDVVREALNILQGENNGN